MTHSPSQRARDLDEMRALLERDRVPFDHSTPGTTVVGTVVDLRQVEGQFSPFPLVTIDDGEHLVDVTCSRSVLSNEIQSRDVRVGDALGIRYEGSRVGKNGTTYHAYAVMHRPGVEPPRVATAHGDDDEAFSEEPF